MASFKLVARYGPVLLLYPFAIRIFHLLCGRSELLFIGGIDLLDVFSLCTLTVSAMYLHGIQDEVNGIRSIASRWKRRYLLVTLGLSAATAFLAIAVFQDGCADYLGCTRWPVAVVLTVITALVYGSFAWFAVSFSPVTRTDAAALAIARAATEQKGICSIASWWKRVALHGMLLLAVGLSAAANFLRVAIFHERHPLRAAARWPMEPLLMLTLAVMYVFLAWVAIRPVCVPRLDRYVS